MKTIVRFACLTFILVLVCAGCSRHACAEELENQENQSLVGRIAHIEGQLLRYVPDEDDWVITDQDSPFGVYDNLFSSEDGNVEIIMPNNTLLRIGGDTQVQLIELTSEATEIDVSSGTARLYNKSSSVEIKATTPFGDVIMPPETVCDIFVHEDQAEVASLKGTVEFIKTGTTTRHEVLAGSSSIIVTPEQIAASSHTAPQAWDGWNTGRDVQWTRRMQARGDSTKYLPESLQDNAYELDSNGRWERVYYEGANRYFWRPVYVSAEWTPFSAGRWISWHGEQTWVPCEPFGYVTHHYGNWVYAGSGWYWAPPVSTVMISTGAPFLNIGMYWYPGRVAWVSSSISIGWFPLAPFEIYYSSRYWGPRCKVKYYNNYYDCRKYKHYKHARYVDHHRYHGSKNYRHAGLRKGHSNEKHRGSARFPENMRRNFKSGNKHQYASTMPTYKDKVKKIDQSRINRLRQASGNKVSTNPFKRTVAKGYENNRKPGKTIAAKMPQKSVKEKQQSRLRTASVNKNPSKVRLVSKQKTTVFAKANPKQLKPNLAQAKKPVARTPAKTNNRPGKLQATAPKTRQTNRQKVVTVRQTKSNSNVYAKNNVSSRQPRANRAETTFSANRTSRVGSSYARSAVQSNSMQNSAGRMQSSAGRGRRW